MSAASAPRFTADERVQRFRAYYARTNKRPLLGFFVGSDYPLQRYRASASLPIDRPLVPEDFRIEGYLDDCDRLFDLHESCGGDFIWSASAFWGIPWLEAALGCPIYADHSTGSIHARPPAEFDGPDSVPEFNHASPWIGLAADFLKQLADRSQGRWPIGTTRMRGISDLLSALYGSSDFILAMLDRPDEVMQVCVRLTDLWIAFAEFQLARIPLFHGGVGSFYYNLWAPAGTVWHQEDAAALLSPELYNKCIREHDERIASAFNGCIMHQHPTKFVPTEFYMRMPFTALELHVDEGGPRPQQLEPLYRKILPGKPLVIWGRIDKDELKWIIDHLAAQGLAVMAVVSSLAEAGELWDSCFA